VNDQLRRRTQDRAHAELVALYGWASAEISEFKDRQWQVVRYVLTADAAIAFVAEKVPGWVGVILLSLSAAIGVLAWKLIVRFDQAMELRRFRQRQVRKQAFTQAFMDAWHPRGEAEKSEERAKDESTPIFATALILGWLLLAIYVGALLF
jgi:hypothetical protein